MFGSKIEEGSAPFDVETSHSRFLAQYCPRECGDMQRGVGSFRGGSFLERRVVRLLQIRIQIFRIDVIPDANKLLLSVGARQEYDGDANEVGRRNARGEGCCCLKSMSTRLDAFRRD